MPHRIFQTIAPSSNAIVDGTVDLVTVGTGAGVLTWLTSVDPALAAGLAMAMVVIFRGLGALLHALAAWVKAKAALEEAQAARLNGHTEDEGDTDGT